MSKENNPYNAGHSLRRSVWIVPKPTLPIHPEETEQESQSSSAPETTYPIQQRIDTHANHEPYDSTVMGSHPPIDESGSA